ncbi:hypothetical protein I3843_09G023100 [Carya illinoinensis]|uniref:START domain-containing protein n=2 Tax=Carya illinoinensis TaxID=32201 RepID=A0A8T1PD57_CARIL|nr:uncharacterized protein LOC122276062 isoform X1 [Carya illinoinensis]XP_042941436.1 uncharacterized protein LOC122276062 isoform X1 [Carya illinoinensis]XP_042941437.1 uncharacterized protein LOC122276062 isoform X1 [Carya illinoinensis]KAG6640703.1 hypothetical protein CIPAW_09G022800 [Carya illinoinensis]KAG6640704.1 hypothetical protein CIPAW_09G022800 [Carya illinoinensis]KAG6640705.1 hypothetical protein CIPAW_09G022800 [Carya illinoinensis]KAG6693864.1 hypothetical protein I3842_09G0
MEKKQKITQYRERLDKTLALPDLANKETLETLVKNQLLRFSEDETNGCNQKVIENRTAQVSFFLDMLRSASVDDNKGSEASERSRAEWKLKQDNEDFRVMYREGLEGSPFHTLLVEGYIDGPIDVCLCTSWESSLYKKWWPQFSVPTFKIIRGKCLQKVRIGEQISLVRLKVPWPLSTREAIVHYFMFEYFQDDLIVVLLNTISDVESIDISTHGFAKEVIPEANGVVRIDVVGGVALQKVTSERSYFRTIANMDIKLDFVPPSLINFISRQLIGSGFRLYQKVVSSISKTDRDFIDALGDPLYTKIRGALYSANISERAVEGEKIKNDVCIFPEEHLIANKQEELVDICQEVHCDYHASESEPKNAVVTDRKAFGEIEEESEENKHFEEDGKDTDHISTKEFNEGCNVNGKRSISISSEVEQALGTLEKVISVLREYGFNAQTGFASGLTSKDVEVLTKDSNFNDEVILEVLENEIIDGTSHERPRNNSSNHSFRHARSNSLPREVNHNKILLASTEQVQYLSVPNEATQVTLNGTTEVQALDQSAHDIKQISAEANSIQESSLNGEEISSGQKKHGLCCFRM